jgi:Fibrinogen beta and gamma chains, C-terminal globular domain
VGCGAPDQSAVDPASGVGHTPRVGVERLRQPALLVGAVLVWGAACGGPNKTDWFSSSGSSGLGSAAASGSGDSGASDSGRAGGSALRGGASAEAGEGQGLAAGENGSPPSAGSSGSAGRAGAGGDSGGGRAGAGGSGGRAGAAGSGGKAGAAGSGGKAGAAGSAGKAGAAGNGGGGGAAVTCPADCASDADCTVVAGVASCSCLPGFVGNGKLCARPISCNQLHLADATLASGAYVIAPVTAETPFMAYCEMAAEGGGWTLVLNAGAGFDQTTNGVAGAQCYQRNCTSLAYSTVPVSADVLIDVRNGALVADNYLARVVITGVATATRGKTVRTLISTGPNYLEKEDNSNLVVRLSGTDTCHDTLPSDMAALVCTSCMEGVACDAPVLVFGDGDPGCADTPFKFAIGAADSYTVPWSNCAGWPQSASVGGIRYYPENFRIWIR